MIRVGTSSTFNCNLNTFHAVSAQNSGLYTNSIGYPVNLCHVAVDTALPLPTPCGGLTAFLGTLVGEPPQVFSDVYVEFSCVSGGFSAVRYNGYNGTTAQQVFPLVGSFASQQLGPSLVVGDKFYVRFDNLLPTPHTFSWYNSASGTSVRDIVVIDTSVATFNPTTKVITSLGAAIDLMFLVCDNTGIRITYRSYIEGINLTGPSYSSWSGSSLGNGGGGFAILAALPTRTSL